MAMMKAAALPVPIVTAMKGMRGMRGFRRDSIKPGHGKPRLTMTLGLVPVPRVRVVSH